MAVSSWREPIRLRAAKVEGFIIDDDDDAGMGSDAMATMGASAGDAAEGESEIVYMEDEGGEAR